MSKSQRAKGASAERELFALLSAELGIIVKRGLSAARDGGCDSLDVPGWAIEVKRCEVLRVDSWWAQALEQALLVKKNPVLFYRKSRRPWTALVDPHTVNAAIWPVLCCSFDDPISMSLENWCQLVRETMK